MARALFRLLILVTCPMFLAIACTSRPAFPSPVPSFSADNYPVLRGMSGERPDAEQRYIGLVKVYAEHHVRDRKGTEGSYLVQGAGTLITIVTSGQQRLYVITARHVVVPSPFIKTLVLNHEDPKRKKEIKFDKINEVWSRVLVGIGVEPSAILLAKTREGVLSDIALLEIPIKEYISLKPYLHLFTRLSPPSVEQKIEELVGSEVRVWGYPAGLSPQAASGCCIVTDIRPAYMILNQDLIGGYSGGLVLHSDGKTILGMPVRSDKEAHQTIALRWDTVESLLNDPSSLQRVAPGDFIEILEENADREQEAARFTYREFYSPFVPITTPESKWWEFWKR